VERLLAPTKSASDRFTLRAETSVREAWDTQGNDTRLQTRQNLAHVASRLPDKFVQSQVGKVAKKITDHYTHFLDEANHKMVAEVLLRGQTLIVVKL